MAGHDLAHEPKRRDWGIRIGRDPITTISLMWVAFLVASVLAVVALVIFGAGERGTAIALRGTARWSFLLFWSAYAGGAIAWWWPRFIGLARHGRELGLAYASTQLVHVGLVLWIIHVATGPTGAMLFFWIGIFCTYLLALFSQQRLRDALAPRLWRVLRTMAIEYIAIVFTADFIVIPLHSHGLGKHLVSYLPFALMLVGGAGVRFAAFWDRKGLPHGNFSSRALASLTVAQFGRITRENHSVIWPAFCFATAIVILLAVDGSLWFAVESAMTLYGPLVLGFGGYVLFTSAVRAMSTVQRRTDL